MNPFFAYAKQLAALSAVVLAACAGSDDRPAAPRICPEGYVKIGASCLDRKPWSPAAWLEAEKFCWKRGDVVASPEILETALRRMPAIFRPSEKTHWSARNRRVFVMNLEEPKDDGEAQANRLEPVAGAKRYSVSHAFRCEKNARSGGSSGRDDNPDSRFDCNRDAETCSAILQILSCLIILDR